VKQTNILAKSKAQARADVHGMHVTHQKSLLSQHVRLYKYAAKRVKLSQPMQSLLDTQTLPKKRPDANFEMSQLQTTLALQLRPESAPLMTATYSKGNFVKSTTALSLSERSHCYMLHSATICHGTS